MVTGAHVGVNALVDAGMEYLRLGLSVIPVNGKRSTCRWKDFQERRPEPWELEKMIGSNATGIAIIFGAVSGWLACADFDQMDAYNAWTREKPELAKVLPTAETFRGRHVYFRGEGRTSKFDGGDLKFNGYAVAPPSLHPDGAIYKWLIPFDGDVPTILDTKAAGFGAGTPSRYSGCTSLGVPPFPTLGVPTHDKAAFIQKCIFATVPTGPAQRNRLLFELVRRIKFSGFTFTDDEQQAIVATWLAGAIKAGTKDTSFAKNWDDWRYGWERANGGPLGLATMAARQTEGSVRDKLIVLCRSLAAPDGRFFLSYGDAAFAASCTKKGAFKAMMALKDDGLVVLVKRGEPHRGGKASEWKLPS